MPDLKKTGIVLIKTFSGKDESIPLEDSFAENLFSFSSENFYPMIVAGRENVSDEKDESLSKWTAENSLDSALIIDMSGMVPEGVVKWKIEGDGVKPGRTIFYNIAPPVLKSDGGEDEAFFKSIGREVENLLNRLASGKKTDFLPLNPCREVAVIGGGIAGMECALALVEEGFSVTLIEKTDQLGGTLNNLPDLYNTQILPLEILKGKIGRLEASPNVKILRQCEVLSVEGDAGNMQVKISGNSRESEIRCGAMILATGVESGIDEEIGNTIPDDERIISLSEFCAGRDEILEGLKAREEGKAILFAGSYSSSYSPVLFSSMLFNCLKTARESEIPVALAIGNAEVARPGAEELYTEVRNSKVTFFKTSLLFPEISGKDGKILATINDVYLKGEGVETTRIIMDCALVVIEDTAKARPCVDAFSERIRMKTGPRSSAQPDNLNLLTVKTNKNGIFLCGNCRQLSDISEIRRDALNVVGMVKGILAENLKYAAEKIIVDKSKCTLCLTCVRVCPHGAIKWSRAAEISQVNCMACGTCTSECPNRAIILTNFSDEEIYCELEGLV